jgi:hypothetical protein
MADVVELVPGLQYAEARNWTARGLIPFHGVPRAKNARRVYTLAAASTAFALKQCLKDGASLEPHGVAFAAALVSRLRHHAERGLEFLIGTDEDELHVLVYQFVEHNGKMKVKGRFASHDETLSAVARDLPHDGGGWGLRLFPADYLLQKLLADYLSLRHHKINQFERGAQ